MGWWGTAPGRRAAWKRRVARRFLAAALAVGAVLATVAATRPQDAPDGVEVVVVTRELRAGHVLVSGDLRLDRWPADVAPGDGGGAGDGPESFVGAVLAGPMGPGELVTTHRVVGAGLLDGQPPGTAAAHVPLQTSGVAAMLRAGDRVDVVAADGTHVVDDAVVLAVLGTGETDNGTLGLGAGVTGNEPAVVLAVPDEEVTALARAVDPGTGTTPTVVLSGT